jgi:hypothetical protein
MQANNITLQIQEESKLLTFPTMITKRNCSTKQGQDSMNKKRKQGGF